VYCLHIQLKLYAVIRKINVFFYMSLKCQVCYRIFNYVTLGLCIWVLVEVSSVFSPFFHLYLYYVYTVLFFSPVFLIFVRRFSLVGKVLKLGCLVGEVWVDVIISFLADCCPCHFQIFLGEWCVLVFV